MTSAASISMYSSIFATAMVVLAAGALQL
jgi:hypothetical protein